MTGPLCTYCNDRGYTYRGGRPVPCANLSCRQRSDGYNAEKRRGVRRSQARLALMASSPFGMPAAVRQALNAGIDLATIRNLTGLSTPEIRQMEKGQQPLA